MPRLSASCPGRLCPSPERAGCLGAVHSKIGSDADHYGCEAWSPWRFRPGRSTPSPACSNWPRPGPWRWPTPPDSSPFTLGRRIWTLTSRGRATSRVELGAHRPRWAALAVRVPRRRDPGPTPKGQSTSTSRHLEPFGRGAHGRRRAGEGPAGAPWESSPEWSPPESDRPPPWTWWTLFRKLECPFRLRNPARGEPPGATPVRPAGAQVVATGRSMPAPWVTTERSAPDVAVLRPGDRGAV